MQRWRKGRESEESKAAKKKKKKMKIEQNRLASGCCTPSARPNSRVFASAVRVEVIVHGSCGNEKRNIAAINGSSASRERYAVPHLPLASSNAGVKDHYRTSARCRKCLDVIFVFPARRRLLLRPTEAVYVVACRLQFCASASSAYANTMG